RPVSFPQDFPSLWKGKGAAPRLVIVDPPTSFCGASFHQATARKVVLELATFAAATGAAVIVVRPLNRRTGASAFERGSAGPSLPAEARSALLRARHPDDETKMVLAVVKSNLCAKAPSLELQISDRASPMRQHGECEHSTRSPYGSWPAPPRLRAGFAPAPAIAWLGESSFTADEL